MTAAERKRELARERQRRYRARLKAGRKVIAVEVDDVKTAEALVAEGDLYPQRDDDVKEVRRALEAKIARWAHRYA